MKLHRRLPNHSTVSARVLVLIAFGACLLAAGCGPDATLVGTDIAADSEPSEQDPTSSTATAAGATPTNPQASGSSEELVVCAGTELPLSALQELEPLESRPEVEEAINGFLESGEGGFWPQDGWQMVTISDTEVYVIVLQTEEQVRQDAEARDLAVSFDEGFGDGIDDAILFSGQNVELTDGTWRWAGSVSSEDCELESVLPPNLHRVEWALDPASPAPTADSATVELLATERECASGQPMGDRLLPPTVVETDDAILITMAATPPDGDTFECQGNPSQPVTVDLAAPLGDRELVEGSTTAGRISDYVGQAFDLP